MEIETLPIQPINTVDEPQEDQPLMAPWSAVRDSPRYAEANTQQRMAALDKWLETFETVARPGIKDYDRKKTSAWAEKERAKINEEKGMMEGVPTEVGKSIAGFVVGAGTGILETGKSAITRAGQLVKDPNAPRDPNLFNTLDTVTEKMGLNISRHYANEEAKPEMEKALSDLQLALRDGEGLPENPVEATVALQEMNVRVLEAAQKYHGDAAYVRGPKETTQEYLKRITDASKNGLKPGGEESMNRSVMYGYQSPARLLLDNEENMALARAYSTTRNPQYWDQLRQRLSEGAYAAETKAKIASLKNDWPEMSRWAHEYGTDPVELGSMVLTGGGAYIGGKILTKGIKTASKASRARRATMAAGGLVAGMEAEAWQEHYQTWIEDPTASEEQLAEARNMARKVGFVIGGLGLAGGAVSNTKAKPASELDVNKESSGDAVLESMLDDVPEPVRDTDGDPISQEDQAEIEAEMREALGEELEIYTDEEVEAMEQATFDREAELQMDGEGFSPRELPPEYEADQKLQAEQRRTERRRPQNTEIPANPDGGTDILDFVQSEGLTLPNAKQRQGEGAFDGMVDFVKSIPPAYMRVFKPEGGMTLDVMADAAYRSGKIDSPDAATLMAKIKEAIDYRQSSRQATAKQETNLKQEEQQRLTFEKQAFTTSMDDKAKEGKVTVRAEVLQPGDGFVVDGQEVEVTDVYPDGSVVLDGGEKFGRHTIDPETTLSIDPKGRDYANRMKVADADPFFLGGKREVAARAMGTGPTPTGRKVRLSEVRKFLVNKLGIPVYKGVRATGKNAKGALGIYKTKAEAVRMKSMNDVPTLAHEIGHHLHFTLWKRALDSSGNPIAPDFKGAFDSELMPLGQVTSAPGYSRHQIRKEGVAEFVSLWMTDPAAARAAARKFGGFFEAVLANDEPVIMQALVDARQMIADYQAMPGIVQAEQHFVFDEKPYRLTAREFIKQGMFLFYDTHREVDKTLKFAEKQGAPQQQMQRVKDKMRGMGSRIHYSMAKGDALYHQKDINGKIVGKGLAQIIGDLKGRQRKKFDLYLGLKAAREMVQKGLMTGIEGPLKRITNAEWQAMDKEFSARADEIYKFLKNSKQLLVDSGVLSKEAAKKMDDAYNFYVPLHRVFDAMENGGNFKKGTDADAMNPIMRKKGSDREFVSPLKSISQNLILFREAAELNQARKEYFDFMKSIRGHGKFFDEVSLKQRAVNMSRKQAGQDIAKALVNKGMDESLAEQWVSEIPEGMLTVFKPVMKGDPKAMEITLMNEGKVKMWQVKDPLLYRGIARADRINLKTGIPLADMLIKAATLPSKIARYGITRFPAFPIWNWLRDQKQAGINSRHGYKPFIDGVRGMYDVLFKTESYKNWVSSGGDMGGLLSNGRDPHAEFIREVTGNETAVQEFIHIAKTPDRSLTKFAEVLEESTRVQEFKLAKAAGKSDLEAAIASREVTLDFGRGGMASRLLNHLWLFFNPGMLDAERIYRELKERPVQTSAKIFRYITVPTLIAWWLGKDDEEIQKLPQWKKDTCWNVNIGKIKRDITGDLHADEIISFPKPFMLGWMGGTSVEHGLNKMYGLDPNAGEKAAKSFMDNTFFRGESMMVSSAGQPFLEAAIDHQFFFDSPVVSSDLKDLPAELQYNSRSSQTAIALGKAAGYSPQKIDHMIRGYFGGLGTMSTGMIDAMVNKARGFQEPTVAPKEFVLWKRFFNSPYAATVDLNRAYKARDRITEMMTVYRKGLSRMSDKEIEKYERENGSRHRYYTTEIDRRTGLTVNGRINKMFSNMSDIGKAMNQIREDKAMSGDTKREKLIELTRQRNDTAAQIMKELHDDDRKAVY